LCRCAAAALEERVDVLVFPGDDADELTDRRVRALAEHALPEHTVGARHELHDRLVGLDLGDRLAALHGVALVLQPLHEAALLHGGGEGFHHDFRCHVAVLVVRR
jgi:hypothetical protein